MAKQLENDATLVKLLDAHTRTMGKASRIGGDQEHSIQGFDNQAYETAQVAALAPLLSAMHPTDQVITRILSTGSTKALELLFKVHDPASYYSFVNRTHPDKVSFGEIIKSGDVDALRILHRAGFAMDVLAPKMLGHAVRRQTDLYLSFVREEIGFEGRILDYAQTGNVLADPRPYILDEVEAELLEIFAREEDDIATALPHFYYRPFDFGTLRLSALCLWGIANLGDKVSGSAAAPERAPLKHLADMSLTNHGRLALKGLEPSLSGILSRPKTHAFYGLTLDDIKAKNETP